MRPDYIHVSKVAKPVCFLHVRQYPAILCQKTGPGFHLEIFARGGSGRVNLLLLLQPRV